MIYLQFTFQIYTYFEFKDCIVAQPFYVESVINFLFKCSSVIFNKKRDDQAEHGRFHIEKHLAQDNSKSMASIQNMFTVSKLSYSLNIIPNQNCKNGSK